MSHVDLAVIGAGFAGLACAQAASLRGLRVVVLDRRPCAGHMPHTTGLLVKEVADAWDIPRGITRKIHGVRLYSPALRSIDLVRGGYYFLATDTARTMRWWSGQASIAGADVRFRSAFTGATVGASGVEVHGLGVRARYLVGADGARSRVAHAMGLGINRRFLVGVEAEFKGVQGIDEDMLHVFIDPQLAPGYIGWVVPGVRITQVGLAARKGNEIRLEEFLAKVARVFDFSAAQEIDRRGGLIPVGGPVSPMSRPGAMVIGDAAGLVSPLTAGGIHTALQCGRAAGLAVSDHLLDAGPDPARAVRGSVPSFFFKRMLRTAWEMPLPAGLFDAALGSPMLRAAAQTIFFHNRGLLSFDTWRDVANAVWDRLAEMPTVK